MTDKVKSFESASRNIDSRNGQQPVNLKEAFLAYGVDVTSGAIVK